MESPMMHPDSHAPPLIQNVPSSSPIFVLIVSKYSNSCSRIFETVKFIAPHTNIKILEIDHPKVRDLILSSKKIRTVPCIALVYPEANKIDFYEGSSALQLLQVEVDRVQKKIQSMAASHNTTDISKVISQTEHFDQDLNATLAGRNITPKMPLEVAGHENMASSSIPSAPRKVTEPRQSLPPAPVQRQSERQPMYPDNNPGLNLAEPDAARPSHDPAGLSSDLPGTLLDDTSLYQFELPPPEDVGMSRQDILGDQNASFNRESDKKHKQNRSRMEEIMRQRDEMDKQFVDPKDPRQRMP